MVELDLAKEKQNPEWLSTSSMEGGWSENCEYILK